MSDVPQNYLGLPEHFGLRQAPCFIRDRAPTDDDIKVQKGYYPIGTKWIYDNGTFGQEEVWILVDLGYDGTDPNKAKWLKLSGGGSGPVISQTGDDGVQVNPSGAGNFDWTGLIVANATNAKPLFIESDGGNGLNVDMQLATTVTPTPGDTTNVGVSCFNENHFSIDATSGMVSLAGGGAAIDQIGVDFNTAPGTDPVVPDGTGLITVQGSTVANATNASAPVATHSRAANTYNVEVQVAADRTGAPANNFDAGLASFDDTGFTVDANGYVQLVGGGGPATLTLTGDDGVAVGPDGTGTINLNGAAVANATNPKPLYFDNSAANTEQAQIQVATALGSAPGDKNDAGICSFDSADFSVDTDGFVTFTGGSAPPIPANGGVIFDDFITRGDAMGSSFNFERNFWDSSLTTGNIDHPGIIRSVGTETSTAWIGGENTGSFATYVRPGGGYKEWEVVMQPQTAVTSLAWKFRVGLWDTQGTTINEGFGFIVDTSISNNYLLCAANGGTLTTTDSGIAANTAWVKLTCTLDSSFTTLTGFVNGSNIGTVTSGFPVSFSNTSMIFVWDRNSTGARVDVDYLYYRYEMNNPR